MNAAVDSAAQAPAIRIPELRLRELGLQDYEPVWRDMQAYTQVRDSGSPDQLWLLQHRPIYTLGLNGRTENLVQTGDIPVARVDRGGQVTYHAPGQLVAYVLYDLARAGLGVRDLVRRLEGAVIDTLGHWDIAAVGREDAPGVYVEGAKIAALGLRVRRGRCYHGLSLNVAMDLAPFAGIHPCGHRGLAVTQVRDLGGPSDLTLIGSRLSQALAERLGCRLTPFEGAVAGRPH